MPLRTRRALLASLALLCAVTPLPLARAHDARSEAAPLSLEGSGFAVSDLRTGAVAFANRSYTWQTIPPDFDGWRFTQIRGGETARITIRPDRDGFVYLASASGPPLGTKQFQPVPGVALNYGTGHTPLVVYRAPFHTGEAFVVPQNGWSGALVLAPAIVVAAPAPEKIVVPEAPSAEAGPPGVVLDSLPPAEGQFIGSPAIVILPDGSYVAAHDIFGKGPKVNSTRIFRSTDRGKTWHQTVEMSGQFFSSLFVHHGALYLLGDTRSNGEIVIRRSTDGGVSWTTPRDTRTGLLTKGGGNHGAPTPVIEWRGRLWRAMEWDPKQGYEHFQASLISAPIGADLLNAASWTRTNLVRAAPEGQSDAHYWLEGNAVVTPAGSLVDILRIWKDGGESAAMLRLSPDGRTLTWDRTRDTIRMPGGGVKFTIRFDPVSRLYWSLVNKQKSPDALRNVLSLISSPDLRHWNVESTLLTHPDRKKHAFQYIDWQFDGDDMVFVSRTSWNGDSFHNANYLAFHRLHHFREPGRSIE